MATPEPAVRQWLDSLPADLPPQYADNALSRGLTGKALYGGDVKALLAELGVTSIGHKVILKKSIAKLREAGPPPPPASAGAPPAPQAAEAVAAAAPAQIPPAAAATPAPSKAAATPHASPPASPASTATATATTASTPAAAPNSSLVDSGESVLMAAGPVTERNLLQQPAETQHWIVLKQGFVNVLAKGSRLRLGQKPKLRLFVLKQRPDHGEACLEVYAGYAFDSSLNLMDTRILPTKERATFEIQIPDAKPLACRTENNNVSAAVSWVVALQQMANELHALPAAHRRATVVSRMRTDTEEAEDYAAALEAIRHLATPTFSIPTELEDQTWAALNRTGSTAEPGADSSAGSGGDGDGGEQVIQEAVKSENARLESRRETFHQRQGHYQEEQRSTILKTEVVSGIASRYRFTDF